MLITATEMKNNFGKYLKTVLKDDSEFIITKNSERVARLVPYVSDIERYFTIRENAVKYDYSKKTVSYEEFMEIYENSSSRMEYINGEIFMMSSPSIYHQKILGSLHIIFNSYFEGKKCIPFLAPFDVHFRKRDIKDPDVMQPDLIIICDLEGNINNKDKYMGTPSFVLEILSDSTKTKDMIYKLNTFMTSGVTEYWIVDPENDRITTYHFIDYKLNRMEVFKSGEQARSESFEGLTVDIDKLFIEVI